MGKDNESYPFAKLHIHSEDAIWLRKRWNKYCAAFSSIALEREKEKPNTELVRSLISDMFVHKKAICDFMSRIYSRASRRMLREAFGDDVEEWMHEHGIKVVSSQSSERERDKRILTNKN